MTAVPKKIRRKRLSEAVSVAITAVVSVPLLVITLFVLFGACFGRVFSLAGHVLFCAIFGVLYYLLLRTIYGLLRWRLVVDDGRFCSACDYDLAGNVTGVCPECGNVA